MTRLMSRIGSAYPHACVLASAVVGAWLASDRYGLRADYRIESAVTAERIEALYAPQFATMTAYRAATDGGEQQRLRAALDAAFTEDPLVVEATIHVRPAGPATAYLYMHSKISRTEGSCVMRSVEQRRAGLIRCRGQAQEGAYDVVEYTRALARTEDGFVLATLALEYRELLRATNR